MYYTTWDIETVNWTEITHIGYYNEKESGVVKTVSEIVDIMERIGGVFFAHYSGGFDNRFLISEILHRYDPSDISMKLIHNQPGFISVKNKFQLRDSFLLLPNSLAKLSKAFGVGEKMDIDRTEMQKYSDEKINEYVLSDCILLYNVLKEAEKSNFNYDLKKLTFPSIAFSNWKKKFVDKEIFENMSINKRYDEWFRGAYYGGRTEVFKRHGENIHYYDVNSMYPYCMKTKPYPLGHPVPTKIYKKGKLGVYDVTIFVPNVNIPPIPIRRKKDHKIIFPTGTFRTKITSVELEALFNIGGKIKIIHDGYFFNEHCHPFSKYVDYYYTIKLENAKNKNAKYEIAKYYLNSLYGKLAQKRTFKELQFFMPENISEEGKNYDLVWTENDIIFDDQKDLVIDKNYKQIWSYDVESKLNYTMVHQGLFVTAYARIELWKRMFDFEQKGYEVYYCDTDSIVSNAEIKTSLELGDLDKEHEVQEGYFISPKLYVFYDEKGKEVKSAKGVDKEKLQFSDYKKLLKNEEIEVEKSGTTGFLESLKKDNSKFIEAKILSRHISSKYDKRMLINNVETLPFNYNF